MKNSIFKIGVILLIILSMTATNLIFVGKGLITYAADSNSTNHKNVEFEAYFKDKDNNKITTLENENNQEENSLYLKLNVKREGYFKNGEISLEKSNFILKDSDSEYVNKIENNTIYLNQINIGEAEIKIKIEPIKDENFNIGLLNMESQINLKGIYRDRTEKDINIKASRKVELKVVENNNAENILNEMQIITNKIAQVEGEEKRIVQISYNLGLKENNYPIKEITSKIEIPTIDEDKPEITNVCYLNNMTSYDYKNKGTELTLTLKNETNNENKAKWKMQGSENIIITLVYEKDTNIENAEITANENVTLYNNKTLETKNTTKIGSEELDNILQVNSQNKEESIYKGKLNAGIERQYQSKTDLKINYASAISNIELLEETIKYPTNIIYNQTKVQKENFNKLFGEEGIITIYDQEGAVLGTITSKSETDSQGNVVISYEGKNVSQIRVRATNPVKEGTLELEHTKTIQNAQEITKNENELKTKITAQYNTDQGKQEKEISMKLEDTVTESKIELNREDLSTVIANNVEMKVILLSNNEKYDLYTNPQIAIQLPEQVENIAINSIDFVYENELSIKDYKIEGKTLYIDMEGTQTQYHEDVIDGSTIVINATINVNKKSATEDTQIKMTYTNKEKTGNTAKSIKIVAPKDITTIYNIQDLGIETIGQEETKQIMMAKSAERKEVEAQIEIINNNEYSNENVKLLGDLPTNNTNNNMGIEMVSGIAVTGNETAKIYYSENPNATEDIENAENGWTDTLNSKSCKFLIELNNIEAQNTMQANYKFAVPANLEYNKVAKTAYTVKSTDSKTKVEREITSTEIEMQTGIGPEVQVKLTANKGGKEANEPIKNGEVIQYNIEVKNTGTEDITDISVKGKVPEGTSLVKPEENYEYTGASYYKELEYKNYETKIENLKVGETVNASYEVRVNSNTKAGTVLKNIAEVKYGEVTKQTEEIENTTTTGNLRVTVKRVTDRSVDLYTSGAVQYFAIIENISNEKQENVKVKTNLSEGLDVERVILTTNMQIENGEIYEVNQEAEKTESTQAISLEIPEIDVNDIPKTEEMEYKEEMNIGTLEPGQNKVVSYDLVINKARKRYANSILS